METKVYKTKPYTLKAVKAYYARNKEAITRKTVAGRFVKKANGIMDTLDNANDYIKLVSLFQLTSYKQYQTNTDVRNILKDRLLTILASMDTSGNDLSFLRLGNEYGDEMDVSYDGNYKTNNDS
jgi:hypothetical protein